MYAVVVVYFTPDHAIYTCMSWVFVVVIVFVLIVREFTLHIYEFGIKIVPHLRILEIISKGLCECVIIFIPVMLVHMTIMRLLMRNSIIATGLLIIAYSAIVYTYIKEFLYHSIVVSSYPYVFYNMVYNIQIMYSTIIIINYPSWQLHDGF